jgi:hypothetical protein
MNALDPSLNLGNALSDRGKTKGNKDSQEYKNRQKSITMNKYGGALSTYNTVKEAEKDVAVASDKELTSREKLKKELDAESKLRNADKMGGTHTKNKPPFKLKSRGVKRGVGY